MNSRARECLKSKKIRLCIKGVISAMILFVVTQAFFIDGLKPYYTIKDYTYQNDFVSEQIVIAGGSQIQQHFFVRGNKITNISLFVNSVTSQNTDIVLMDINNKTIKSVNIDVSSMTIGSWNKVSFDCDVTRGKEYILQIFSENGVSSFILDNGERPETFAGLYVDDTENGAALVAGIQQTYAYITWASTFEFVFTFLVYLILALGLCFAIFNAEKLKKAWGNGHDRKSLAYAIYFAVSLVLVFDPIDTLRIEVNSFGRVIGSGFINNVDVSRRVSNFNHWFFYFAVAIVLFYALVNYFRQKELRENQKKVLEILDQIIILANVNLLLRCITYFADQSNMQTVFYYSSAVLMFVVLVSVAYIVLGLDKKIPPSNIAKIMMIAFGLGFPIAIISQHGWQGGKLLLGYQIIITVLLVVIVYLFKNKIKLIDDNLFTAGALVFSLIPFITSFYIEFINILNQHGIFVYRLRRGYAVVMALMVLAAGAIFVVAKRKKIQMTKWKLWSYSWLIFGITCLQQQIPLEKTYSADIFESANYSILISDFLNFGDIPIIQHYGGHMMTGVWEGLLYAVFNNDYAGAIFSPYSGYLNPVLAMIFFLIIRKLLGNETALLTTLFFPFMSSWSYYGLGMLVCIAVWGFFKKNTYQRAALVWLAFIWATIYRLDLGFSIGAASIAALAIWVIVYKNWKAAKQLIITLLSWGVFGGALWCILCQIRHVNPVNRLIEFLMINLSNQNWAYNNIGDAGNTLFSWCYIIVPFVIAGSLCYVILSKKFRQETSQEIWIALLILGFSYFSNFSRGLVRHSLAETETTVVLWDAFIYLALFIASYKRKKEWFLPSFVILIMSSTFLTTTANYTEGTIGDSGVSRVGDFTSGWTLDRFAYEDLPKNADCSIEEPETYWKQLYKDKNKVDRAKWADDLKTTIKPYEIVMGALLEDDETFVDFINKTFVYSAINRRNPVYMSQSPLQMSGEFTQEMFIEEMEGIPLVLMPVNDNRCANSLDGIVNSYRCYKVAEYIYQNYVPLCRYGDSFAVWCLPERYDELKQKVSNFVSSTEYVENLYTSDKIIFSNCEKRTDEATGNRCIAFTGVDPMICELQKFMDLTAYVDCSVKITVAYNTNVEGDMQIYYTSVAGENYTAEKMASVHIDGNGTAEFIIPVTENTRIRLDTPEGSTVAINSLKVSSPILFAEYGYDDSSSSVDDAGNTWNSYDNGFHSYNLSQLPNIWAKNDDAINNEEYVVAEYTDGYYVFNRKAIKNTDAGNYLKLKLSYDGTDTERNYYSDDETVGASIKLGVYKNGKFTEKYQYNVTLKEGTNEYLIRVSNDYYWYYGNVNAVKILCEGVLHDGKISILEGD